FVDRLRVDEVEPQAVVQGQPGARSPGVLGVIEMTPLTFPRVGIRADVAAEVGHVAEEERGEAQSACALQRGPVRAERQLTGSMHIARYSKVVGTTNIDAELEIMSVHQLRDVANELKLLFVLVERAVT